MTIFNASSSGAFGGISGGTGGSGGSGDIGGANGGAGGAGISGSIVALNTISTVIGGNGGGGGVAVVTGNGGSGGVGGSAIAGSGGTIDVGISGSVQGANGGVGGTASGAGNGGTGGVSGSAISGSGFTITNAGLIFAGVGGTGGDSSGGGNGGNGGAGAVGITGSNLTITNLTGAQIGGGVGGVGGTGASGGAVGAGGAAIAGSNITIVNDGTIVGGTSGGGASANAITFTGGTNVLELQSNSSITGNVVAASSADTLRLGGSASGTFDLSQIGAGQQFQNFGTLAKTGSSTWTVDNGMAAAMAITVSDGTLALGSAADISLSTVVTVNGAGIIDFSSAPFGIVGTLAGDGTLQMGSTGLVVFTGSTEFSGTINGSNGFELVSGTQTLSGVNTYTNATQIDGGSTLALKGNGSIATSAFVGFAPGLGTATLDISQVNSSTSVAGIFDPGGISVISLGSRTLVITNGASPFNGVIQDGGIGGGTGGSLVIGPGASQDLGGVNTYTGSTTVMAGAALNINSSGSIAASSGVNLAGTGALFDISLSGVDQTIQSLSGVAGTTVQLGGNNLTVGSAASTTFAGTIDSTTGGLIKQGSGTLTLTFINTYSGGTTINAGLINFNSLANFGTGAITLNGGGLQWASGNTLDVSASVVMAAGGATFDTNGNNVTLSGNFSGAGAVTKAGAGVLTLTGSNTYGGGTTVTGGLINFAAAGNLGTGMVTLNGGGLQWATGNTTDISSRLAALGAGGGTFDTNGNNVTLASAITGSGGLTKAGLGTLILSGNNSYAGGTTVSAGVLQGNTASLQGNIVNNAAVTFNQTGSGTYAGNMSGTGNLTVQGGGTLILTGTGTYAGPTTVNASTLVVNGTLASTVTLNSGSTIGGTGTIGGLAASSATIAPGNSIGTLNIAGNFSQTGGIYVVEANAQGQSDRINATGTATINGGTVQVIAAAGNYGRSTRYTIVNATGGVSGSYASVSSNFAFLTPSLTYDANNVFLTLALQGSAFSGFGGNTVNQRNVGYALDQTFAGAAGDFATVIGALAGLSASQAPTALDAISGQPYADFGTMNVNNSAMFMNALGQQMANARSGNAPGSRVALAQACEIEACDSARPLSAWFSGLGGLGSVLGDGNSSTLTYNFGGAAAGLDYRFDPRFLVGLGVGYTHGTQWVNSFMGQGWSDSFSIAAYGSFTPMGPGAGFYADALAGYAYFNNQMQRQILIPGLQQRTASGSTGANQFLAQVESGYKLGVWNMTSVTPFARLQMSSTSQGAFTESGANALNLSVAQQTTNSLRSVLGAQFDSSIALGNERTLGIGLRFGWQHEYAYTGRPISASFAGAPSASFTVYGATPQRDSAIIGFSATTNVATATQLYLRYDGELATGTENHALTAGLRMSW